jgi:hypothetical protein
MQTPNGYSWMAEPWVNSGDLVNRMNFAVSLSNDRVVGVETDWTRLLGGPSALAAGGSVEKERKLEAVLLGQAVSDRTRETVLAQFQDQTAQQQAEKSFGIRANEQEPMAQVLNVSSPKRVRPPFDREAAGIAGLLLGSPEFQRR